MVEQAIKQRLLIAVIGAGQATERGYETARKVGQLLAEAGVGVVCGGLAGVMEGVARGCCEAGGEVVGILPGTDATAANPWVTIAIPTGLGHARNVVVVQSAPIVIAIEGEYGTLSELAIALKSGRSVISLGGWQQIPGVVAADNAEQAVALAVELLAKITGNS